MDINRPLTILRQVISVVFTLLVLGACSANDEISTGRESITIESTGGQSGMEGSCAIIPSTELNFDAERAIEHVIGRHNTAVEIHPWARSAWKNEIEVEEIPVSIEIVQRDDSRVRLPCGNGFFLNVKITVAFQEPALDIIFNDKISIFSETEAVLQITVDAMLGEHLKYLKLKTDDRKVDHYQFILWFTPDGVHATIASVFEYSTCTVAAIPPREKCLQWGKYRSDVDTPIQGVLFQEALERLAELEPLPAQWEDGSTTNVSVSLANVPQSLCVEWSSLGPSSSRAGTQIIARGTLRIKTEDEKVDLELPSKLIYDIPNTGNWDKSFGIGVRAFIPKASIPENEKHIGYDLSEDQVIEFNFTAYVNDTGISGRLNSVPITLLPGLPPPSVPLDTEDCQLKCISNMSESAGARLKK